MVWYWGMEEIIMKEEFDATKKYYDGGLVQSIHFEKGVLEQSDGSGLRFSFLEDKEGWKYIIKKPQKNKEGLEIKMQDQLKALDSVARHLGMFVDKSEVNHSGELTHNLQPAPKLSKEEWLKSHGLSVNK